MNIGAVEVFYFSAVVSVILFVEAAYILFAASSTSRRRINRRIAVSQEKAISQKEILVLLRKERGLDAEGNLVLPVRWLNLLIVQSGITAGLSRVFAYYGAFVLVAMLVLLLVTRSPLLTLAGFPVIALALPYLFLNSRRNRKMARFGRQLPEAIDLITRSLKAGHPVPVAISMVAREMPDPIGSEFGMVADEVTYGSDLVTALNHLYDRVGHPDLPLLVSSVSIQSTTGGNLREILEGLSKVIRDRLKMKAKIKAISAEGRMSAIFLSAMPIILFMVLLALIPDYYGGIWKYDETYVGFTGLFIWLVTGNLMIMKMVSFKV
ncbi:MAG: type II secretion system protein F [Alphaproteobacteria bacterium]|nr:MAG: type II secretion system protein F [Alphaproteobacteria bacterium]